MYFLEVLDTAFLFILEVTICIALTGDRVMSFNQTELSELDEAKKKKYQHDNK